MTPLLIPLLLAVPIDIELTAPSTARINDTIAVKINVANHSPDVASFAGVDVILSWDPTALEPVDFTTCDSFYDWFLVMVFTSDDPANLFHDCLNQDADDDGWPDNDGDLLVTHALALGTNDYAYNTPSNISVVQFRVLRSGEHTVSMVSSTDCDGFSFPTQVLDLGNVDVTGDITDAATVQVLNPADVDGDGVVGIVDLLAVLAAWGTT